MNIQIKRFYILETRRSATAKLWRKHKETQWPRETTAIPTDHNMSLQHGPHNRNQIARGFVLSEHSRNGPIHATNPGFPKLNDGDPAQLLKDLLPPKVRIANQEMAAVP